MGFLLIPRSSALTYAVGFAASCESACFNLVPGEGVEPSCLSTMDLRVGTFYVEEDSPAGVGSDLLGGLNFNRASRVNPRSARSQSELQ